MKAEIALNGPGGGRIVLDGQEAHGVRGLTLSASVGEAPQLVLDVLAIEETTLSGEVRVHIREETRDLLIRLGWTPPVDDTP